MSDEFRAVVHPQMSGRWVELEQFLDRVDHLSSFTAPAGPSRQAGPAVLINHVEELECPPIHSLVELEVDVPDVVRIFGPQQFPFATGRP